MAIARSPTTVLDCPYPSVLATFPQQAHLDVMVDDLDEAEAAVIALGATKHEHQPGETFRVFLDPAGHPFCICVS